MMKLTDDQLLEAAYVQLVRSKEFAFAAGVIMYGKRSFTTDLPTAATNGVDQIYNPDFMRKLSPRQRCFVVIHEGFHKMLKHMTTWQGLNKKDPNIANKAMDYVINGMIDNLDPNKTIVDCNLKPHLTICLDHKYDGMDARRVFLLLMKEQEEQEGEGGSGEPGEGEPSGAGKGGQQPMDTHQWEEAAEYTEEKVKEIGEYMDQAMRQGDILAGKMAGKTAREIGALPEPVVNWREQLRDFVSENVQGNDLSTWRRPNRRWAAQGLYLPSRYTESVGTMVIGIDTSGSIGVKELNEFLAEVRSIVTVTVPEKVHLLYWDTEVAGEEEYTPGMYEGLTSATQPKGGGGTDPQCVREWLEQNPVNPAVVINLTDGYLGGDWPVFTAPTLWVSTTAQASPTGVTIHI